jgi:hypothetical protein
LMFMNFSRPMSAPKPACRLTAAVTRKHQQLNEPTRQSIPATAPHGQL